MHIKVGLVDQSEALSQYKRIYGGKQSQKILTTEMFVKFIKIRYLFEAIECSSLVLLLFKTLFIQQ